MLRAYVHRSLMRRRLDVPIARFLGREYLGMRFTVIKFGTTPSLKFVPLIRGTHNSGGLSIENQRHSPHIPVRGTGQVTEVGVECANEVERWSVQSK